MKNLPTFKIRALLEGLSVNTLVHVVDFIEGVTEKPSHGKFESEIKETGIDAIEIAIVHLYYALAPLHPIEANIALQLCEIYVIDKEKSIETDR